MFLICGEALHDVFIDPMGPYVRRKVALGTFAAQTAAATCPHKGPEFPYRKALHPPV